MSDSMTFNLALGDFARFGRDAGGARVEYPGAACKDLPEQRIALHSGEQLRVPDSSQWLHMLVGTAWLTMGGLDYIVSGGDCLRVSRDGGGAVISALRNESISFELS
jgi:hypothetical protein